MSIVGTETEWVLWREAQSRPEFAATRFWEHKLQKYFPASDGWVVSSQQPPTGEKWDRRRVENVIEILDGDRGSLQRLLIIEAKRQNTSKDMVTEVEYQGYEACQKYLKFSHRDRMYAMTLVGTAAKLWWVDSQMDYLDPFVPAASEDEHLSDLTTYIEANSIEGKELEEGLDQMKQNRLFPPKRHQILKSTSTPEPVDADISMADAAIAGSSRAGM